MYILYIYIYINFLTMNYISCHLWQVQTTTLMSEVKIFYIFQNVKQVLVCITSYHVFLEGLKIFLLHKYINCKLYSFEIYFNCNFTLTQDYDFIEKKNNNSKPSLFLIQVNFEHL